MGKVDMPEEVKCCAKPSFHVEFPKGWDIHEGGEEDQYICDNCKKLFVM